MYVKFEVAAQDELDDAFDWYLTHAWDAAERFLVEGERAAEVWTERPTMYAQSDSGVRRARLSSFPYALVYTVEGDEIVVLAVEHMKRRPDDWKDRQR